MFHISNKSKCKIYKGQNDDDDDDMNFVKFTFDALIVFVFS